MQYREDVPVPAVGSGEVLINVAAAGELGVSDGDRGTGQSKKSEGWALPVRGDGVVRNHEGDIIAKVDAGNDGRDDTGDYGGYQGAERVVREDNLVCKKNPGDWGVE